MSLSAVDAIRRYVFGFVNSHDFSVCRELMSDDYLLHMGDSEVVGREAAYIPAVQHQIDQFPDMGMTVHDVITDGDHAVLHFSEHGRTRDGLVAAWPGVSIYRFDGTHLVECWVEQDHYSRRKQLTERRPLPLPPASTAPFSGHALQPSVETDAVVRRWLSDISSWPPAGVEPDPGPHSRPSVELNRAEVVPNVIVATSGRVAFHATVWGDYQGSLPDVEPSPGSRVPLHTSGIASVREGHMEIDYMATNRIALLRRLKSASAA
jgi:hypothetical protein